VFKMRSAMGYFTLPTFSSDIVEILITSTDYMTSYNTGARTFGLNLETLGTYKYMSDAKYWSYTLTINNGGSITGDVFFVCKSQSNGTVLTFQLKNSEGKIAKRTVTLSKSLNDGAVNRFGTLPFTDADFTHDSYE